MISPSSRRALVFVAAIVLMASFSPPLGAQYFGRNKVQYKQLDFQVLKTEHFDIYFYPEERDGIDISARLAERWHARLERVLEHQLRGRQPLVLYASHPDFEQTNVIEGELGEGTGGVTEPVKRRIVLPLGGPIADTDHVIGHELVHAFQFDITSGPNGAPGQNGAERLPLWFIEGMAEYLSLGPVDPNTAMWLRDAARQEKLPSIDDLANPKYFPYRWGQAFWAYVGGRFGDNVIPPMLRAAAASGDPAAAISRILGVSQKELSADWQAAIRSTYAPILAATTPPNESGQAVVRGSASQLGGDLNVGPSISPDGRWIAFLSERSLFSIDLYIADASTGKIVQKLTSTATDPHYSSIQFIYSAGAWDASSKRIAIATVTDGRPALAIFDAQSGRKDREIALPSLDEIFNPTWAPDGHAVCFTGLSRGLTDLYVLDLNGSTPRQLTHDAFADLQPAWSPDGRSIAFATDRFTSHLATLDMGPYRLALIDPNTGAIRPAPGFTTGKNINPQWSRDGASLLFISDRDGISNLYRVTLADGAIAQLTNIATGVSGITNTSPALSVAADRGTASFTVYDGGKYDIYTVDVAGAAGPVRTPAWKNAAVLPPADRQPSDVAKLLADASTGLPVAQAYQVAPYKPTLQLLGLAQPTVAVGASRYGAAVGGGISFEFGDMLNNHQVLAAVQLNSGFGNSFSFKDTAAEVAYFNQAKRWTWGLVGGQVPYFSGGFQAGIDSVNGEPVEVDQTIIFRQTERSATGIVAYPFNRVQRIEFQSGVSQITFDQITQTSAFSLRTGQLVSDTSDTTSLANPLTLASTSAALVYDTANFGATSPVQGQRYRFEISPTFGSLNFTNVLLDYRRYVMPASFYTIATRIMHFGRYGTGGDDSRMFPVYIGYPDFVRGYDVASFDSTDCQATLTSQCPIFDRLTGSRALIGNLELRFPLLRPFGASNRMYGPIPVEVALFTDGGVTWNGVKSTTIDTALGTTVSPRRFDLHDGVASAGVALRVNLFGFFPAQWDPKLGIHVT